MGTGPSSDPILLPFRGKFLCFSSCVFEILERDLLQDNFTMALYSFGGLNDQCGARHGLYKRRLGRERAYGVDAFLSSPEQAFFTIGFAQTNE